MNSLSKMLTAISGGPAKSNAECIIDHLVSHGEIALTDHQKKLLERVESIDEMFSQGRFTQKEIVALHARRFAQSESQSKRDLQDAEYIFGTTKRSNKRAKIYRHIERIETAIILAQRSGPVDPRLYDTLSKALALLPEDKNSNAGATTIIMNFTSAQLGDIASGKITAEEADRMVAERVKESNLTIDLDENEFIISE